MYVKISTNIAPPVDGQKQKVVDNDVICHCTLINFLDDDVNPFKAAILLLDGKTWLNVNIDFSKGGKIITFTDDNKIIEERLF